MAVQIKEARPPYVQFEAKAVEDRAASNEAGHYVPKDIDYAMITPQGSKDRIQRVVSEWFEHLEREVREERFPAEWLDKYRNAYRLWKEGQEIPLEGTSVKNWPFPSPAQVALMIDLNIRTVEDMCSANEETIRRMGMGGRGLQQAAAAFLDNAKGGGQNIKLMDVLRAENDSLKVRNESLEKQVQELSAQVTALRGPEPTMRPL